MRPPAINALAGNAGSRHDWKFNPIARACLNRVVKHLHMPRLLSVTFGILLGLVCAGCDDAKKLAYETKEGYHVLEQVAGQVAEMSASLRTNDFAGAKEIAGKLDVFLNTRVLSWTVQILATEEKDGVEAAKALIRKFNASENITADEQAALAKVQQYFQNKGREKTGDLAFLVAALVVEGKYGHGAGGVLLRLRETYRKSPLPVPTTPTDMATQKLQ